MTQIPNSKEPNKKRAHTFGGPFDQPRFYEIESRCQRLSSTFSGKIFGLCSPRLNNPITGSISKKNLHTRRTCPTTNPPQPPTPNPQPPATFLPQPEPTLPHQLPPLLPAPTAPTDPQTPHDPPPKKSAKPRIQTATIPGATVASVATRTNPLGPRTLVATRNARFLILIASPNPDSIVGSLLSQTRKSAPIFCRSRSH